MTLEERDDGWHWVHRIHRRIREAGPFKTRDLAHKNWVWASQKAWYKERP